MQIRKPVHLGVDLIEVTLDQSHGVPAGARSAILDLQELPDLGELEA